MLICGSVQANMHVSNQLIDDKDAFSYLPPFSMLWDIHSKQGHVAWA